LIISLLIVGSIAGIYIGLSGFSKLVIAGLLGIVFLFITVTRPWIAVTIFFLLIPLESLFVLQSGITATLTKLFGAYMVFLALIYGALKYINEVFNNKKVLWILLYGAIALISVVFSRNTGDSLKYVITLWLSIVLYFVLIMMIRDMKTLHTATLALLTGAVISILSPLAFGFGIIMSGNVWERYGGLWGDQNEFASVLLVLMPISIAFFFIAKKRLHKILYLSYSVIIFTGFVLTYSRGGFLAFIVMLITAMFKIISGKNRARILAIAIPCIIIAFTVFYFTLADQFISRMETLRILESRESVRTESSLDKRYYYYFELAPKLFVEHPILGVGFRDFVSHNIYKQISHNTYLEVLTGTGLAGFISFMMVLFFTWKELRALGKIVPRDENQRYLKMYGNALELGFLAFLVAGCFISADIDKMLWLCVTLSAIMLNIIRILYANNDRPYNKSYRPDYGRGTR
jgi:O-antigen ligase